jgi:hypothetical protein
MRIQPDANEFTGSGNRRAHGVCSAEGGQSTIWPA